MGARCGAVALILCTTWSVAQSRAESPAAACARSGNDDTRKPIPAALVPAVNAVFGTSMPAETAVASTVFRCANGHVLVCTAGANLPCGPANTSRVPGPGASAWCRDHPDETFIPAVATGHDTIFAWRCRHGAPVVDRQVLTVDARGFVAQYWKSLPNH